MPTWSPNWDDVRFDPGAAEAAAEACERTARVIRDRSARRHALAVFADISGSGPWRTRFDEQVAAVAHQGDEVEAELRRTAHLLRTASQQAQHEQRSRIDARNRWALEARAEVEALARSTTPP